MHRQARSRRLAATNCDAPRSDRPFSELTPTWSFASDPDEAEPAATKRKPRRRRAANPDADPDIDATRAYFNEIGRRPLLTAEQEQELGAAIERARWVDALELGLADELGYAPKPMQVWAELLRQLGELNGIAEIAARTLYLHTFRLTS